MESKLPTRRRWFQYSLRSFLIMTMVVGFGGAWVGMQLQQKRRHEAVVNEIVKLDGNAFLSEGSEIPAWKEWLFGSYAVKPVVLDLNFTEASDSILAQLQSMNIVALFLNSTKVTDAGLAQLKGSTSLEGLYLGNTQITDAGLIHLKELTSLEELDLSNTQVTSAGLPPLQGLNNLKWLDLRYTQVPPASVDNFEKGVPGCRVFTLQK